MKKEDLHWKIYTWEQYAQWQSSPLLLRGLRSVPNFEKGVSDKEWVPEQT